ncbi:hypothetical protein [Wukongibacter sp. M2B1]|uniref:hypothetical protein n=1 Tax=Wukongibacter sp. M2B1 TaxID=3088895 RepID=UPI003D7933DD
MNIKRLIGIFLIITFAFTCLVGCGGEQNTAAKEVLWTIGIEGVKDESIRLTNIDAEKIEIREITAILKKKDGSETEQAWKGYGIKEVLDYVKAGEYSSIVVEAGDGYSKEYTKDLIEREGTILGVILDGKALEEDNNRVQLVVQGEPGNLWIKDVAKIIVNK